MREGVLYYELCFVCIMPGRMFSEGWLRGQSGVGRIRKGRHLTDRLWNSFKGNSCMWKLLREGVERIWVFQSGKDNNIENLFSVHPLIDGSSHIYSDPST